MACMSDTHGHHNTSFLSLENLTAVHETVVVTDIACLRWLHSRDSANLTVLQNRQRVSHYLDCLQDIVAAALAMQIAHEMDPLSQHHKHDMERLMRRIPQTVADVLEVQHACSLVCVRPKSHYLHAHIHTRMYAHTHAHTIVQHAHYNVQELGGTAHAGDCHHCCELCCTLYIHVMTMRVSHNTPITPGLQHIM